MTRLRCSRLIFVSMTVAACAVATHASSPVAPVPDTGIHIQDINAQGEIVVSVGPIDVPAATAYSHHAADDRIRFRWPSEGWLRGYRIDIVDRHGRVLPREVLHHVGVANLDRRQLAYPIAERLVAVGRETPPILLPASLGVPLSAGQDLVMYYALTNPTAEAITGVTVRMTITFTTMRPKAPRQVLPLFLDANPLAGEGSREFDVPPGVSATSAQFTLPTGGRVRALGAHVHDHAVEIRLEDVVSGKVLARLKTKRHPDGRLISVASTRFVFTAGGLRLAPNHPYRVVSIYDNPTGDVIKGGAMAFLAGAFIPDDLAKWPAVEPGDQSYARDRDAILGTAAHAEHKHR
jgi:hypothetical protein